MVREITFLRVVIPPLSSNQLSHCIRNLFDWNKTEQKYDLSCTHTYTHTHRAAEGHSFFFSLTFNVSLIAFLVDCKHCSLTVENDFSAKQYFQFHLNANEMERCGHSWSLRRHLYKTFWHSGTKMREKKKKKKSRVPPTATLAT